MLLFSAFTEKLTVYSCTLIFTLKEKTNLISFNSTKLIKSLLRLSLLTISADILVRRYLLTASSAPFEQHELVAQMGLCLNWKLGPSGDQSI